MIASFSRNADSVVPQVSGMTVSHDGGETFGPVRGSPFRNAPVRLHDGRLLAADYYSTAVDAHTNRLGVSVSSDDGRTWQPGQAVLTTPGTLSSWGVAHGSPVQLADGTLLQTFYARYAGSALQQPEVYASTDGARTFTRRGVLAVSGGGYEYNEATVAQVADGSLLAVLRRDGGAYSALFTTRSRDRGATWTPPAPLVFDDGSCLVPGVDPELLLMPNGVLVLSAGRPDVWLAVSTDGAGERWEPQRVTYHNRDGVRDTHGTSGYSGIAPLGPHRLIQVFDNCKLPGLRHDGRPDERMCPRDGRFEHGTAYGILRRHVRVHTPFAGPPAARIDLAGLLRRGGLTVETTMTWPPPGTPAAAARPRTGIGGAFDGSTEYWSSAVGATARGEVVLHLRRGVALGRIGLSLRPGHPADAEVYVSADGGHWGRPVVTVKAHTGYAMDYFTPEPPRSRAIRHIKIITTATTPCDAEIGPRCAMLNEIELYSAATGAP
ncbi:sialidase family protein [Thermocatellispora tengchongensis]|uniref:sialidase family protein n=1 Tax=Thermocatellispora tengchongensis TaxID=1073253 RepID=UPI00363DEAD6